MPNTDRYTVGTLERRLGIPIIPEHWVYEGEGRWAQMPTRCSAKFLAYVLNHCPAQLYIDACKASIEPDEPEPEMVLDGSEFVEAK